MTDIDPDGNEYTNNLSLYNNGGTEPVGIWPDDVMRALRKAGMAPIPDREPPIGVWMQLPFMDDRVNLMTTYKGWDGEQHVWVAWVPTYVDEEVTQFGAITVPAYTTIEFRQPKPEWDATKVSEKNYMPFEIACEGIRNMTALPDDVELKFAFLSTFKIQVERVDGEPLPDRSMSKAEVTMPYPVARPGVKTQIGSM